MSETKKHKEFWMDTDLLDKALDNCDLGDGYSAKVRQYPHRLMIPELTHVIEYSALLEEKQKVKALEAQVAELKKQNEMLEIKYKTVKTLSEIPNTIKERNLKSAVKVLRDAVERFCNDEGYSKKETSGHYLGQALSKVEALLGGDV